MRNKQVLAIAMSLSMAFTNVSFPVLAADNTESTEAADGNAEEEIDAISEATTNAEGQPEMNNGEQPPEKPDGNGQGGPDGNGQQPPEKPDGNGQGGPGGNGQQPPEKPDGNGQGGPGGNGGPGGSSAPTEYTSVIHYTEDASAESEDQESTGTDENIAWVSDGASVDLSQITASKTSDDSTGGDQSSFYGVGAAYLVTDGTLNISDSTISTDSAGGAGVFAYGDGVANVSDTTITTTQGTSGGIHVAGGGTLNATNLTVETNGASSAAIRSDRGSGTMNVEGGTYTSNGTGSPAVYSTADITVSDATLTATNSEAVCIEGLNSLRLTDCDVSSSMPDNEQNDCKWSVILYQSMSGDSEIGNSTFEMTGGSLTSTAGGLFYTTNTESSFTLDSVVIETTEDPDFFLKCTGNSNQRGWGSAGNNGADCTFTAINQNMDGDIIWDSISTLDLNITENSTLIGAIIDDESNAGTGGDGSASVTIDSDSTWVVTGDSTLTTLDNDGTIVDENNNIVTIVGTDGTAYVSGDSEYTITIENYL